MNTEGRDTPGMLGEGGTWDTGTREVASLDGQHGHGMGIDGRGCDDAWAWTTVRGPGEHEAVMRGQR